MFGGNISNGGLCQKNLLAKKKIESEVKLNEAFEELIRASAF